MRITASALSQQDKAHQEAEVERLFQTSIAVLEMFSIYVGDRLGLYRALAQEGGATAGQLAGAAGIDERYAREWLEQQAVAGILEVDKDDTDGSRREYRLPAGHKEVLLDGGRPNY